MGKANVYLYGATGLASTGQTVRLQTLDGQTNYSLTEVGNGWYGDDEDSDVPAGYYNVQVYSGGAWSTVETGGPKYMPGSNHAAHFAGHGTGANGSIGAADIPYNTIHSGHIIARNVLGSHIALEGIEAEHLADLALTIDKLKVWVYREVTVTGTESSPETFDFATDLGEDDFGNVIPSAMTPEPIVILGARSEEKARIEDLVQNVSTQFTGIKLAKPDGGGTCKVDLVIIQGNPWTESAGS